jgi:hypothetical protein
VGEGNWFKINDLHLYSKRKEKEGRTRREGKEKKKGACGN